MDQPVDAAQGGMGQAVAALRLQMEWGADEALDLRPLDRLNPVSMPAPVPKVPALVKRPPAQVPAATALASAGLEELLAAWAAFDGSALRATAAHAVLPSGDPSAGLLLLGEAPDDDDDRAGRAFAGAAGEYLDRMLGSVGLGRAQLRLAYLVPWRPPGGRPPSDLEIRACLPFLHRYLVLAPPRRLVLLGNLAVRSLLGQVDNVRRARGRWRDAAVPGLAQAVPAIATHAPSQVRTTPRLRQDAWADLLLLRAALDGDTGAGVESSGQVKQPGPQ